jgi:hypothetical protein
MIFCPCGHWAGCRWPYSAGCSGGSFWRLASIRTIVTVAFLGFLGTLYYAGRTGEALVEQDGHLGRLIGAWFLWLVFCLGVGVGILLDHWWNTRHPKPPTTPGEPTETP